MGGKGRNKTKDNTPIGAYHIKPNYVIAVVARRSARRSARDIGPQPLRADRHPILTRSRCADRRADWHNGERIHKRKRKRERPG